MESTIVDIDGNETRSQNVLEGRGFIVPQGYLVSHPPRKCPGSYEKQAPHSVKCSDEGDEPELGSKTNGKAK